MKLISLVPSVHTVIRTTILMTVRSLVSAQAAAGEIVTAVVTGSAGGPPEKDGTDQALYSDVFGRLARGGVRLLAYVHVSRGRRPVQQARFCQRAAASCSPFQ